MTYQEIAALKAICSGPQGFGQGFEGRHLRHILDLIATVEELAGALRGLSEAVRLQDLRGGYESEVRLQRNLAEVALAKLGDRP